MGAPVFRGGVVHARPQGFNQGGKVGMPGGGERQGVGQGLWEMRVEQAGEEEAGIGQTSVGPPTTRYYLKRNVLI